MYVLIGKYVFDISGYQDGFKEIDIGKVGGRVGWELILDVFGLKYNQYVCFESMDK